MAVVAALALVAPLWPVKSREDLINRPDADAAVRPAESADQEKRMDHAEEAAGRPQVAPRLDEMAVASLRESLRSVKDLAGRIERNASPDTGELMKILEEWTLKVERTISTRMREDLFELIPVSARYFARTREMGVSGEFRIIRDWMEHAGPWIVRELGKVVEEKEGKLDSGTAERAIRVFSVRGFDNEPDWEDHYKPLDGAGVLIASNSIIAVCEGLTLPELDLLIWTTDAEKFFRRYTSDGDGLEVLKNRYEGDRDRIHREFFRVHEIRLRRKAEETE